MYLCDGGDEREGACVHRQKLVFGVWFVSMCASVHVLGVICIKNTIWFYWAHTHWLGKNEIRIVYMNLFTRAYFFFTLALVSCFDMVFVYGFFCHLHGSVICKNMSNVLAHTNTLCRMLIRVSVSLVHRIVHFVFHWKCTITVPVFQVEKICFVC